MFENHIEQARTMLIQEKVGLISSAELISWADETLTTLENAPDFLVSISMEESLAFAPRLDLIQDPIADDDCPKIALRMLDLYKSGKIGFDQIDGISLRMIQELNHSSRYFPDFDWITDELHLAATGIKDEAKAHQDTIYVLTKISGGIP
jgi:hypothetical protein